MLRYVIFLWSLLAWGGCTATLDSGHLTNDDQQDKAPFLMVLGIAQDAGYPQAACRKSCCQAIWDQPERHQMVACIALVDPIRAKGWLLDATPDFKYQLRLLEERSADTLVDLAGIFLTHAHIGHYTGLMHLGREVMGASEMPVYAMPKMGHFLSTQGPWSQLVELKNIAIQPLTADSSIHLGNDLRVRPFLVPHRGEFSETVGFHIQGPNRSAIYIPDIDKWEKWDRDIREEISQVDLAFLDGTFYANGEIPGRDMSLIPHPFIEESMVLFSTLPNDERAKIYFTHFNHTNPVLEARSEATRELEAKGFQQLRPLQKFGL
ncbi:MAG: MBL fold metallo-hydrolase [Bacteroidota bacterium]